MSQREPNYFDLIIFQTKASCLRLKRIASDIFLLPQCQKWPVTHPLKNGVLLAESKSILWDEKAPHAEKILQAGKVHNLRIAAKMLDGCTVPANKQFNFWCQIGCPTRLKGYVKGRELRQGCIIPTIAGGLCQLSNALYDTALKAGFTILERHAHTQVIPGSMAETGRDATVFWNYVNLRFSFFKPYIIRVHMTAEELIVQLWNSHES